MHAANHSDQIQAFLLWQKQANNFHAAAKYGDLASIKKMLAAGLSPNALNDYDVPVVFSAVANEVAYTLLEKTDPKFLNNQECLTGDTILHAAAECGNVELINRLLAAGANPNILNYDEVPAVYYAVESGHKEAAFALLKKTDPELLDFPGAKAVIQAHAWAKRGALLMLRYSAHPEWRADDKESAAKPDA